MEEIANVLRSAQYAITHLLDIGAIPRRLEEEAESVGVELQVLITKTETINAGP